MTKIWRTERRRLGLILLLICLASACTANPSIRTVKVTAADSGRHVTLAVGDQLLLSIGSDLVGPGATYFDYPRANLRVVGRLRDGYVTGVFRFDATNVGTGWITVDACRSATRLCVPPGLLITPRPSPSSPNQVERKFSLLVSVVPASKPTAT